MANKRIQDLTAAGAITGTELLEIEQSSSSKKATVDTLGTYYLGTIPTDVTSLQSNVSALQTDKQDIQWTAGAGGLVLFEKCRVYGSAASPVAGNITLNIAGLKLGVEILIIHNQALAPSFPASFSATSDSAAYSGGVNNYIKCQVVDTTGPVIKYKIYQ